MQPHHADSDTKREIVADLVAADPHAPRYHFIAPEGAAMPFDPNGAIFWKGKYHLFYIFQDPTLPDDGHSWGHASSTDLLHWTFHPTALSPAADDPERGIFSGGACIGLDGKPTLVYHGCWAGMCIATSDDDDLIHWTKSPHNPVIPDVQDEDPSFGVYNVFDPHPWVEGDTAYVVLGAKVKPHNLYDTLYLFSSKDMIHWDYQRQFYAPNPEWTGPEEDCACPDFFKLGDRYMLSCISHPRGARYYLGRYEFGTFIPEEHHRMNFPGGSCFAPESLLDDTGRRVFWAWVLDQRRGEGAGHGLGVMTMPRIFTLDDAGQLQINPPAEFEQLRSNPRSKTDLTLEPEAELALPEFAGDVMELSLEATVPEDGKLTLFVRSSDDGTERTGIVYDPAARTLSVDAERTTLAGNVLYGWKLMFDGWHEDVRIQTAPLELAPGEPLHLRVFLDKSIMEVYANGTQCITQRLFPTKPDATGVSLLATGAAATVHTINAWDMKTTNGVAKG
jgi:beta-fructofuranosidase